MDSGGDRCGRTAADCDGALADQRLVDRCLAGEVAAWEELYAQCHQPLCTSIHVWLRPGRVDPNLVDEIAARVWYALVANDGELLARYNPKRGARVITFMRALAKDEACRHFRSERRRLQRELTAVRDRPVQRPGDLGEAMSALSEFLGVLTPRERQFCGEHLLAAEADQAAPPCRTHSPANIWQLSRRIQRKLRAFLGQ